MINYGKQIGQMYVGDMSNHHSKIKTMKMNEENNWVQWIMKED